MSVVVGPEDPTAARVTSPVMCRWKYYSGRTRSGGSGGSPRRHGEHGTPVWVILALAFYNLRNPFPVKNSRSPPLRFAPVGMTISRKLRVLRASAMSEAFAKTKRPDHHAPAAGSIHFSQSTMHLLGDLLADRLGLREQKQVVRAARL